MKKQINRLTLKNGLFLGLAVFGLTYAFKALDLLTNMTALSSLVILMIAFGLLSIIQGQRLFGLNTFRDKFSMSFKTSVVSALIIGIGTYLFFSYLGGETYLEEYISYLGVSLYTFPSILYFPLPNPPPYIHHTITSTFYIY